MFSKIKQGLFILYQKWFCKIKFSGQTNKYFESLLQSDVLKSRQTKYARKYFYNMWKTFKVIVQARLMRI